MLTDDAGYELVPSTDIDGCARDVLDIIWGQLNRSAYADWGVRSKQYLESGGKNPPRIMNIRPAINEFYGIDLPYQR